jgi:hypothetical protein
MASQLWYGVNAERTPLVLHFLPLVRNARMRNCMRKGTPDSIPSPYQEKRVEKDSIRKEELKF